MKRDADAVKFDATSAHLRHLGPQRHFQKRTGSNLARAEFLAKGGCFEPAVLGAEELHHDLSGRLVMEDRRFGALRDQ